jgi:hypothetical protein
VWGKRPQQPRTYAGYPIERLETAKRSVCVSIGHNDLRERDAYPRQACELGRLRNIRIDQLARCEGPCLALGTVALRRW